MNSKAHLQSEIQRLKKEKNALVLAHYYQDGDIQDVADAVGDSYFLAKKGQESDHAVILLAGVTFMAESVKIMNPTKTVLVPDMKAGCSLVNGAPFKSYLEWRRKNPMGITVTYINSSAEVKSISDVIVTSSNAEKIVAQIPKDRPILFGPDKNLGNYLSKKLNREMIFWPGVCEVHVLFSARKLAALVHKHPDAVVIAHPECEPEILQYASVIGSTSRLLEEVEKNPAKKFIVATESGIFHEMKRRRPEAELIQAPAVDDHCSCNDCPYMKMNSLEKIVSALKTLQPEVKVDESLRQKALIGLDRMMKITEGQGVAWPSGPFV